MPPSLDPRPASDRRAQRSATIPELDSLRGVAIALVLLVHAEGVINFGHPRPTGVPFLRALACAGHTGVSLFFVLSAFLLTRPFLAEIAGGPAVDRGRYFLRRFWRTVPLYALAVVITTVVTAEGPADLLRGLPYLFFLNFTIPPDARVAEIVSGVWWSLSTEWQFYLLLPLLPLAVRSRRARRITTCIALVYVAAYTAFVQHALSPLPWLRNSIVHQTIFVRGPIFAWGMAAAFVYERWGQRIRSWATATRWVYAWGADVLFFALVLMMVGALGWLMTVSNVIVLELMYPAWHIVEGACWAMVLLFCLLAPLRARAVMRGGHLRELGRVSYSVYLIHEPILLGGFLVLRGLWPNLVGWSAATVAVLAVLSAAIIAVASVLYRHIEEPLMWREAVVPAPAAVPRGVAAGHRAPASRVPAAGWSIPVAAN